MVTLRAAAVFAVLAASFIASPPAQAQAVVTRSPFEAFAPFGCFPGELGDELHITGTLHVVSNVVGDNATFQSTLTGRAVSNMTGATFVVVSREMITRHSGAGAFVQTVNFNVQYRRLGEDHSLDQDFHSMFVAHITRTPDGAITANIVNSTPATCS